MKVPSNPEYLKELAAGYVVGDLSPEEAEEFKQQLQAHPELVTQVNCLQDVLGEVLYGLNEVEPPAHLGSSILEVATADIPVSRTPLERSTFPWGKMVGSVAALLVLSLGVANYRLWQELNTARTIPAMLQHSGTRLFSLKGTIQAASGSVVMDLEQQKVAIAIRHLPVPPEGSVYRLWAVSDGDKIPCGAFSAQLQGIVFDKISIPADLYDDVSGVIVTLETSRVTSDPVGPVVMKSI
jgi:anti-sigma-K factor RskA